MWKDHNLFYATRVVHSCAMMHYIGDDIYFLSGHLLCDPHPFCLVFSFLPALTFYITLWLGPRLEGFWRLVSALLQNYYFDLGKDGY
jgi:hypothetical protein